MRPASSSIPPPLKYEFKAIILGSENTGKSTFTQHSGPLMIASPRNDYEIKSAHFKIDSCEVIIYMNDLPHSKMSDLTSSYFRSTDIIFLFFNPADRKSFDEIDTLYKEGNYYSQRSSKYLIANCFENKRQVSREEAEEWAANVGVKYFELNVMNISKVESVLKLIIAEHIHFEIGRMNSEVEENSRKKKKKVECIIS